MDNPAAFADARPVLYNAWPFRLAEGKDVHLPSGEKISYTPRVIAVRRGKTRFFFPGETFETDAGDVIYIPPSVVYQTEFTEGFFESYNLFFDFFPGRADSAAFTETFSRRIPFSETAEPSHMEAPPQFSDAPELSHPIYLHGCEEIFRLTAEIVRQAGVPGLFAVMDGAALLTLLLVRMVRKKRQEESGRAPEIFSRLTEYVQTHIGERLSGERLARALNYHPYYLNRIVVQAVGQTLHGYILDLKIREAKRYLISTDLSLSEIAQALAFCDASHFSHVFSSREGITPMRFRESCRFGF